MKTKLIFLAFLLFNFLNLKAQCQPAIVSPRLGAIFAGKILFCDSEDEILSTTQTYSSYQWYKQEWSSQIPNNNPWEAIPGATAQQLTINGNDVFTYFKVEVAQGDCTAESSAVLADGYAYGLPAMMSTFVPGTYEIADGGVAHVCQGAPVKLDDIFSGVYGPHIWFKCVPTTTAPFAGDPCVIPNVTGATFTTYESGEYGFYACTEYCPDQCKLLDPFAFLEIQYGEWQFCENLGTGEVKHKENKLNIYPNPTAQFLYIGKELEEYKEVNIMDMSGKLILKKTDHQYKQAIDVSHLLPGIYMIISKSNKGEIYKNKFIKK